MLFYAYYVIYQESDEKNVYSWPRICHISTAVSPTT